MREKFNSVSKKNGNASALPIEVIENISSVQTSLINSRKLKRK